MNDRKSYLKIILSIAGLSAVSIAVFMFPSCDSPNGKSLTAPKTHLPVCTGSTSLIYASPKNFPLKS